MVESGKEAKKKKEEEEGKKKKWKRREVELVDGTREVGFFIDAGQRREARIRLELR